ELEVTFGRDKPSMAGNLVRLPEPPRKATRQEISVTRGLGDSMALRRARHDSALHARLAPAGAEARAVFDAVEQARVEAIGARAMPGVALNLANMLEDRFARANLATVSEQADAPLDQAIALMVREALTGARPPRSAERTVELWRNWVQDKAG